MVGIEGFQTGSRRQELYNLTHLPLDGGPQRCLVEHIQFRAGFGPLVSWSPDGRYIAYATHGPLATGDIYLVDVADGIVRSLTEGSNVNLGNIYTPPLWAEDMHCLYAVAGDLWQVAITDGAVRNLTVSLVRTVHRIIHRAGLGYPWSRDEGASLYVQTFDEEIKKSGFHRVYVADGRAEVLVEEDRLHHRRMPPDIAFDSGTIAYIAEDTQRPADAWAFDIGVEQPRQLTQLNLQLQGVPFGKLLLVDWVSPRGRQLQGALLLPPGSEKPYPLVTRIYGGSRLSNKINFFGLADSQGAPVDNMHLLAQRGYAVFLPDIPIESEDLMGELEDAVNSGVDKVINLGIADPGRLGIMGHSYGGWCVNAIVTRTTRFQAAISSAGVCNLISAYGVLTSSGDNPGIGRAELGQRRMGGGPWEHPDRYVESSPIFHLGQVETPLLLLHGELDVSCPVAQAGEMFSGLRRLNKEVALVQYIGEDHWPGSWRYTHAVDYWWRIIDWFDRHL